MRCVCDGVVVADNVGDDATRFAAATAAAGAVAAAAVRRPQLLGFVVCVCADGKSGKMQ